MRQGDLVDGRFELGSRAGAGGMGTVYRAIDGSCGATVAIKVLHEPHPAAMARFLQEARALASIDHPHIVRYITHGKVNLTGLYYSLVPDLT